MDKDIRIVTLLPLTPSMSRWRASSLEVEARGYLNAYFGWYVSALSPLSFIKVDVIFTILGFRSLGTRLKLQTPEAPRKEARTESNNCIGSTIGCAQPGMPNQNSSRLFEFGLD
jgi:hypothetical protein